MFLNFVSFLVFRKEKNEGAPELETSAAFTLIVLSLGRCKVNGRLSEEVCVCVLAEAHYVKVGGVIGEI